MNREELQNFIYSNIPIVEKNCFTVKGIQDLTAQIKGHHNDHSNHRNTVFGGSISTVLILAAWSHLRLMMEEAGVSAGTVVGKQSVTFYKPVTGDFFGTALPIPKDKAKDFFSHFKKRGKAKLTIKAQLIEEETQDVKAEFSGEFFLLSDSKG